MVRVGVRVRVWVSRRKCDCCGANVKISRVINLGVLTVTCADDNCMCPCLDRCCSGMSRGSRIWIDNTRTARWKLGTVPAWKLVTGLTSALRAADQVAR